MSASGRRGGSWKAGGLAALLFLVLFPAFAGDGNGGKKGSGNPKEEEQQRKAECAKLEKAIQSKPDDADPLVKILPLYHALKQDQKAAETYAKLRKLYEAKKFTELQITREEFTVQDSFAGGQAAARKVRAIQYFAPTPGETSSHWPISYQFDVFDENGGLIRRIFLEIDPMSSKKKGKNDFWLDENHWVDGRMVYHASYGPVGDDPGYEKVRPMAVNILEGKGKVVSQTGRPSEKYRGAAVQGNRPNPVPPAGGKKAGPNDW